MEIMRLMTRPVVEIGAHPVVEIPGVWALGPSWKLADCMGISHGCSMALPPRCTKLNAHPVAL